MRFTWSAMLRVERAMGVEPTSSAWKGCLRLRQSAAGALLGLLWWLLVPTVMPCCRLLRALGGQGAMWHGGRRSSSRMVRLATVVLSLMGSNRSATIEPMERDARLGRSMTLDEVADLLGWSEADKVAHMRALEDRPDPDLDEARARVAARTPTR